MALLSLITGQTPIRTSFAYDQQVKEDGKVRTEQKMFLVDVTVNINPQYSSEVTLNPVEKGRDVTDHIRPKNVVIQLEGFISESPIDLDSSIRGLAASAVSVVGSRALGNIGSQVGAIVGGVGASLLQNTDNPAEKIRSALIGLWESKAIFTISAPNVLQKHSKDLVITSLSFPRSATTGRGVAFSCTMQQIQLVERKTVRLNKLKQEVQAAAAEKAKLGQQQATIAKQEPRRSILKVLAGASGNG